MKTLPQFLMLSLNDIRRSSERKYPAFLKSVVTAEAFFPLEIRFGKPSPTDDWVKLQQEINSLTQGDPSYRIDWVELNTRRWGRQKLPQRVWFETEDEFLSGIKKEVEVRAFRRNLESIRRTCPHLEGWLIPNVMRVIEFSDIWQDLLKVCNYFLTNPRPGLYIRELPIAVETKFIERYQGILRSLLDFLLPASARSDDERFEVRFGLRFDESIIRVRILDTELQYHCGFPIDDISTPLTQFCSLDWKDICIVIAENKVTFLGLPRIKNSIAVFGGGGAALLLGAAGWLANCHLIYWGDIDVHGFHILSGLRKIFPTITSVMMDRETLQHFSHYTVPTRPIEYEDQEGLTEAEKSTYQVVKHGLLLEQERIPIEYAMQELSSVLEPPSNKRGQTHI